MSAKIAAPPSFAPSEDARRTQEHPYLVPNGSVAADVVGWDFDRRAFRGVTLADEPVGRWPRLGRFAKRTLDVVVALVALVVLAPLLLALAIAVKRDSRGPALFRQRRMGRNGRPFRLYKFRSMVTNAEDLRAELLARSRDPNWLDLDEDPRVTRLGRFLRQTSLDELPQLWNVLRGHMSLIGPRPLILPEHERLPEWAHARDEVRPGLTGLWQVSGRTTIPFEGMLILDRTYVTRWSLRTDLGILLRTVPVILRRTGAN